MKTEDSIQSTTITGWTCTTCNRFVMNGVVHACPQYSLFIRQPDLSQFTDTQLLEELLRRAKQPEVRG